MAAETVCDRCGREFSPAGLPRHREYCTAERPEADPRIAEFKKLLWLYKSVTIRTAKNKPGDTRERDVAGERLLAWLRAHLPGEPDGYLVVVNIADEMTCEPLGLHTSIEPARDEAAEVNLGVNDTCEVFALHLVVDGEG